jgi:hypothetical protein
MDLGSAVVSMTYPLAALLASIPLLFVVRRVVKAPIRIWVPLGASALIGPEDDGPHLHWLAPLKISSKGVPLSGASSAPKGLMMEQKRDKPSSGISSLGGRLFLPSRSLPRTCNPVTAGPRQRGPEIARHRGHNRARAFTTTAARWSNPGLERRNGPGDSACVDG